MFKVGDIVIITNHNKYWDDSIVEVTEIRSPSYGYGYRVICKLLKPCSGCSYGPGKDIGGWPAEQLRLATVAELADLDNAPTSKNNTCQCPSAKLFNFGCQCGGK